MSRVIPDHMADVGFKVRRVQCETCIYRPDSPLDLERLEDDVRDPHGGFKAHRVCHYHNDSGACCRGFWDRHKDSFPMGQVAQRLRLIQEIG